MLSKTKTFKRLKNQIHFGKNISLKKLSIKNCNETYLSWLNDPKINQYLESRISKLTLRDVKDFVRKSNLSNSTILFGIFDKKKHIGNIKIEINWFHGVCTFGYMIGEDNYQGKNIGTESIKICVNICLKYLKLRSCFASLYSDNVASRRVLEKNGFKKVAVIKNMYKLKKKTFSDELVYRLNSPISKL